MELRFSSRLGASPDALFAHATSADGINAELAPFRMTFPAGMRALGDREVPLGEVLFTSWFLLGAVPVDRLRLRFAELDRTRRRFVESSDLLSMRRWQHTREVSPESELVDTLRFEPRAPGLGAFVRLLFRRRHAALRRRFGSVDA